GVLELDVGNRPRGGPGDRLGRVDLPGVSAIRSGDGEGSLDLEVRVGAIRGIRVRDVGHPDLYGGRDRIRDRPGIRAGVWRRRHDHGRGDEVVLRVFELHVRHAPRARPGDRVDAPNRPLLPAVRARHGQGALDLEGVVREVVRL